MTAMQRWLLNGKNLLEFVKNMFVGNARDISVDWYEDNGDVTTYTYPNFPKVKEDLGYTKLLIEQKTVYYGQGTGIALVSENGTEALSQEFDVEIPNNADIIELIVLGRYTRKNTSGHQRLKIYFSDDADYFYIGDNANTINPTANRAYWGISSSKKGTTQKIKIGILCPSCDNTTDKFWINNIVANFYKRG